MTLMTENIYDYCGKQKAERSHEWLYLKFYAGRNGVALWPLAKSLQASFGAKSSSSTIGKGGVSSSNAPAHIDIHAQNFALMNTASLAAGSGSSPCIDRERFGLNGEGPLSIECDYIRPTNGVLAKRIGDDNSLIGEDDLGPNQDHVEKNRYPKGSEHMSNFGVNGGVVETRPGVESADKCSKARQQNIGAGAEGLSVIHLTILSQIAAIRADSIKAVR